MFGELNIKIENILLKCWGFWSKNYSKSLAGDSRIGPPLNPPAADTGRRSTSNGARNFHLGV